MVWQLSQGDRCWSKHGVFEIGSGASGHPQQGHYQQCRQGVMAGGTAPTLEGGMVSNQLAMLVPSFDASCDDVTVWSGKVQL